MVEEVECGITSPSCPWGVELPAAAVQEALLEKRTIFCSSSPQLSLVPCPNLSVPGLSACPEPQITCILSLASGWDSKLHALKGLLRCAPAAIPRWRGIAHSSVLSPKSHCTVCTQRLDFIVRLSKKLESDYHSSALHSVP